MKAESMSSLWIKLPITFALLISAMSLSAQSATRPALTHKTLDQPTELQGYPCARGDAWFFQDGRLNRCTVTREVAFGEARIPAGTYIALHPDGTPDLIQLPHNSPILGLNCMGGSWLGPSEGAMVAFYPNGKLKQCFLVADQTVQGVPCAANAFSFPFATPNPGALFDESGKLRACKLAKDFGAQRKGDRFAPPR